jgi:hypothetical protein
MKVTYGRGFLPAISMHQKVERLQEVLSALPQYEPPTTHYFHAGMYCREVWRKADVMVVGVGEPQRFTGPHLILSAPGTKRAVYAETDVLCMTFHRTDATTVEAAEAELVEEDAAAMYGPGNLIKHQENEVLP